MYEQFGTYGAWLHPALGDARRVEYAPELEELGFQTVWVGIGSDPVGDMNLLEQMIAATRTATIASAIVNMWQDDAQSIAHYYHRIVDRHGPRLLLGIGLGHPGPRQLREALRAHGQLHRDTSPRPRALRGHRDRGTRSQNTEAS